MYKCLNCGKRFQNKKREDALKNNLLYQYIWQRQTYSDLANKYNKSKRWIQNKLDEIEIKNVIKLNPQPLVVVADVTFFSKANGLIVFRDPNKKKNVWWNFVPYERVDIYEAGRKQLEKNGFTIQVIILDGKPGVRRAFEGIPAQMCHFHQKQIVKKYLTSKPKLEASKNLQEVVSLLANTNEEVFTKQLNKWYEIWKDFLKEKTTNPETNRWCYKHKRLRSAYRSLQTNLPYLFTYQKHPELNIPNTTNSLDEFFNSLKSKLYVHRGINRKRGRRVIVELLKGRKVKS